MTNFISPGYVTLREAVDLMGRHLSDIAWTGKEIRQLRNPVPKRLSRRLESAVHELRSLLASDKVLAIAVAENGQRFPVPTTLWLSQDGRAVFDTGIVPPGNLRESLRAKQEGTLIRRILVPKAQLQAAFGRTGVKAAYRTPGKYSKKDLSNWYQEYVASCTKDGRIPTRDEELNAARAAIGDGVPRDAVREARRQLAPDDWKAPGRRKTGGK